MKVQDLQNAELDYWVARIERGDTETLRNFDFWKREVWDAGSNRFSSSWANGGPIIERHRIYIEPVFGNADSLSHWDAGCYSRAGTPDHFAGEWAQGKGSTALEAAMKAYVASRFGDEVSHPTEKE